MVKVWYRCKVAKGVELPSWVKGSGSNCLILVASVLLALFILSMFLSEYPTRILEWNRYSLQYILPQLYIRTQLISG